ncbi:MAG: hypothetical protein D6719_05400 [Candidatus Dadabacteria bacterium]|nr:MAG: hypothetical protein D6719_05400 [Candidatus Dadabacteria bacterium]
MKCNQGRPISLSLYIALTFLVSAALSIPLHAQVRIGEVDSIGRLVIRCDVDSSARFGPTVQVLGDDGKVRKVSKGQSAVRRKLNKLKGKRFSQEMMRLNRVQKKLLKLKTGPAGDRPLRNSLDIPGVQKTVKQLRTSIKKGEVAGIFDSGDITLEDLLDQLPEEALNTLLENTKKKRELRQKLRNALKETKRCKGCVSDSTQQARAQSAKSARCGCYTRKAPASIAVRTVVYESACSSIAFIQWDNSSTENVTSATAHYGWFFNGNTDSRSKSAEPPYSNSHGYGSQGLTIDAPTGSNWIAVESGTTSHLGGGSAGACTDIEAALKTHLRNPSVELRACPQS